jgi:hypothetical protein
MIYISVLYHTLPYITKNLVPVLQCPHPLFLINNCPTSISFFRPQADVLVIASDKTEREGSLKG